METVISTRKSFERAQDCKMFSKTISKDISIFMVVFELVPIPVSKIGGSKKVKHFDVDTQKHNYKLNDWHFVYAFKNFERFLRFFVKVTSKSLVSQTVISLSHTAKTGKFIWGFQMHSNKTTKLLRMNIEMRVS